METRELVIWGCGGHAKVVTDAVRAESRYRISAYMDDVNRERWGTPFMGQVVEGGRDWLLRTKSPDRCDVIVAFGDSPRRLAETDWLLSNGFSAPPIAHPTAVLSPDANIGFGSFVGPGAIVNAGTRIGRAVIVNSGACVEHDCTLADGVHLAPGACLAGYASVGRETMVGIGAIVSDRIVVGAGCVVGAGSVVVRDVPDGVVVFGVPARVHREVPQHADQA